MECEIFAIKHTRMYEKEIVEDIENRYGKGIVQEWDVN